MTIYSQHFLTFYQQNRARHCQFLEVEEIPPFFSWKSKKSSNKYYTIEKHNRNCKFRLLLEILFTIALIMIGIMTGKMRRGTVNCENNAKLAKTFPTSRV